MSKTGTLYLVEFGKYLDETEPFQDKINDIFKIIYFKAIDSLLKLENNSSPQGVVIKIAMSNNHTIDYDVLYDSISSIKAKFKLCPILLTGDLSQLSCEMCCNILNLGVDDYFDASNFKELKHRLNVQTLKRNKPIKISNIIFDYHSRIMSPIKNDDCPVKQLNLPPIEANIIRYFLNNIEKTISREELKKICWPNDKTTTDNALNRKIHSIRDKLNLINSGITINTIYGSGFMIKIKNTNKTNS